MSITFTADELDLALKRVERDHDGGRVFVSRTTEWIVLRQNRAAWLARLEVRVTGGTYVPGPVEVADVPKGGGTVRAGNPLSLVDEVIYTGMVGRCIAVIQSAIDWQNPHPDCSYLFRKPDEAEWLGSSFQCWQRFGQRSLDALTPPVNFVVPQVHTSTRGK